MSVDEELSKNYFEASLLQASEHFAKKGTLMYTPQAAASLQRKEQGRAAAKSCMETHRGALC